MHIHEPKPTPRLVGCKAGVGECEAHQIADPSRGGTRSEKHHAEIFKSSSRDARRRVDPCKRHRGGALNVIVEAERLVPVAA